MREVDAQTEFVKAIKGAGGMAHKQSNRFLVGVVDLAIKLPLYPLAMIEAKMAHVATGTSFDVEVTQLQRDFLQNYDKAGTVGGVVSFVTRGREFGVQFLPVYTFEHERKVRVLTSDHAWCPMGPEARMALMLDGFKRFMHDEEKKWAR